MRSQTIARIAWYIPRSETAAGLSDCEDIKGISGRRAGDIVHFAECYKNLRIGWDAATALFEMGGPFPALLHGRDLYVWRAYNYLNGADDDVIEGAASIYGMNKFARLKGQINAMLVTPGIDCGFVANALGIRKDVVEAYEVLFYNVIDRAEDHAFIANMVYPDGRIAEAFQDYLSHTDINDLMLRAGYSHGIKHVLYAIGLGKHPYQGKDAATGADQMDSMFMAEGCLYADFGFAHQASHNKAISNARMSMQAGKLGGGDQARAGMVNFGDTLKNELITVSRLKAEARAKAMVLDAEVVIPDNISDNNGPRERG